MKKIFVILTALLCFTALVGCGKKAVPAQNNETSEEPPFTTIIDSNGKYVSFEELASALVAKNAEKPNKFLGSAGKTGYYVPSNMDTLGKVYGITVGSGVMLDWDIDEIEGYFELELSFSYAFGLEEPYLKSKIEYFESSPNYEKKDGFYVFKYTIKTEDEKTEYAMLQIEWIQEDCLFLIHVPAAWPWEDVVAFCTPEWVEVNQ